MGQDKDIRFVEKKVDESWKEQADKDRSTLEAAIPPRPSKSPAESAQGGAAKPSAAFMGLLNSLAYQAMFHMGEMQPPGAPPEINLEAAKEAIELLTALREKTRGNLAREEGAFLDSAVSELQMKYVQLAS